MFLLWSSKMVSGMLRLKHLHMLTSMFDDPLCFRDQLLPGEHIDQQRC